MNPIITRLSPADASAEEKKNGMSYAHTYVSKTDRPLRSISVVNQRRAHHCYAMMNKANGN